MSPAPGQWREWSARRRRALFLRRSAKSNPSLDRLDVILEELRNRSPRAAAAFELRHLASLRMPAIAAALESSEAICANDVRFAWQLIARELGADDTAALAATLREQHDRVKL